MCYVSTQQFENFPSLSMAEAMSTGNAVIAKNAGQTYFFVKENKNGFLCDENSPVSLAEKMKKYILLNDETKKSFGEESIRLIREVHNRGNFIAQTDEFWSGVLGDKNT